MSKTIKVRACVKCKVYVVVHTDNATSTDMLVKFERDHAGHMLITTPLDDIKDSGYSSVT